MFRRVLKEPLFHFLLIGAGLFVVFGLVNDTSPGSADYRIVVSPGRIQQLENIFVKTWQRPPTAEELQGLVDDFVLEEVYYRQAVAMGIDRDDTVIRRRLRQKYEFLTDDIAAASVPTDAELAGYFADNADAFIRDTTYSFDQVYINPDQANAEAAVATQLAALRAGHTVLSGAGLLPAYFEATSARAIDGSFGSGFSQRLDALPIGEWQGPVESGLGLHLIRLRQRETGTLPELEEIRPVVEREWANERRLSNRENIKEQLLGNYEVMIEWPTE